MKILISNNILKHACLENANQVLDTSRASAQAVNFLNILYRFCCCIEIRFKSEGTRENKFPIKKHYWRRKITLFLQSKTLKIFYALFCPFREVYVICGFLIYVEKNK